MPRAKRRDVTVDQLSHETLEHIAKAHLWDETWDRTCTKFRITSASLSLICQSERYYKVLEEMMFQFLRLSTNDKYTEDQKREITHRYAKGWPWAR